ncbi:MAG: alanine/glycine:cation symporter family protein [Candidatus Merdivicinus sp.]
MTVLDLLTGPAFLLFLAGAGIFFTVRLKGIQFLKFGRVWRETFGNLSARSVGNNGAISSFQATATALAGTLGTGNIAGVATAIVGGGPGAVFWMWISSLFAMALKYAEIVLAVRFRSTNERGEQVGGPMYYMEKGLGCRWMAIWFATACVLASFGIGNMAQANAASQSFAQVLAIPEEWVGLFLSITVGFALFGGIRRIACLTERLVPLMAAVYVGAAAWILVVNHAEIPAVIGMIVRDAFHFSAATGGVTGFLVSQCVRFGIARGVFSNEAGMGSAPIVHGAADTSSPGQQGMWGIVEVFLDTTLMCTVTALVILTSKFDFCQADGSALTILAFESVMGKGAGVFLAISILFFAMASIMGWSYCGEKALEYLSGSRRVQRMYRICYLLAVYIGSCISMGTVWQLSDLLNLCMAVPNCVAVLLLSSVVKKETAAFLGEKSRIIKR